MAKGSIPNLAPGLLSSVVAARSSYARQERAIEAQDKQRGSLWERVGETALGKLAGGAVDLGVARIKEEFPESQLRQEKLQFEVDKLKRTKDMADLKLEVASEELLREEDAKRNVQAAAEARVKAARSAQVRAQLMGIEGEMVQVDEMALGARERLEAGMGAASVAGGAPYNDFTAPDDPFARAIGSLETTTPKSDRPLVGFAPGRAPLVVGPKSDRPGVDRTLLEDRGKEMAEFEAELDRELGEPKWKGQARRVFQHQIKQDKLKAEMERRKALVDMQDKAAGVLKKVTESFKNVTKEGKHSKLPQQKVRVALENAGIYLDPSSKKFMNPKLLITSLKQLDKASGGTNYRGRKTANRYFFNLQKDNPIAVQAMLADIGRTLKDKDGKPLGNISPDAFIGILATASPATMQIIVDAFAKTDLDVGKILHANSGNQTAALEKFLNMKKEVLFKNGEELIKKMEDRQYAELSDRKKADLEADTAYYIHSLNLRRDEAAASHTAQGRKEVAVFEAEIKKAMDKRRKVYGEIGVMGTPVLLRTTEGFVKTKTGEFVKTKTGEKVSASALPLYETRVITADAIAESKKIPKPVMGKVLPEGTQIKPSEYGQVNDFIQKLRKDHPTRRELKRLMDEHKLSGATEEESKTPKWRNGMMRVYNKLWRGRFGASLHRTNKDSYKGR